MTSSTRFVPLAAVALATLTGCRAPPPDGPASAGTVSLERIEVRPDGGAFVRMPSGERFVAWGVNYDHDAAGRLLEDYWEDEWETVVEDFGEIAALGMNVVRIHLQLGRFMAAPDRPDAESLERLSRLVGLAEGTGLYLDVTGLGCYHADDVPEWYDALAEAERWAVQARFWSAVARVCHKSSAIFCYDLMNEPILPGADRVETEWLAGEFGGKHFVQRLALDLNGRTRADVARAWVDLLVAAIEQHDPDRLITVGVIPWAHVFPNARPLFYSPEVGARFDFVAVHFYPKAGQLDDALAALAKYEVGKPLIVEEMYPLSCNIDELAEFVERSREQVDGWISFYWGRTVDDLESESESMAASIQAAWLGRFAQLVGSSAMR